MAGFFTKKILSPFLIAAALLVAPKGIHAQAEAPHHVNARETERLLPGDPNRAINQLKLMSPEVSKRIGHDIVILDLREIEGFSHDSKAVQAWVRQSYAQNGIDLKELGKVLAAESLFQGPKLTARRALNCYFAHIADEIGRENGSHTYHFNNKLIMLSGQKTKLAFVIGKKKFPVVLNEETNEYHEFFHALEGLDDLSLFASPEERTGGKFLARHFKECRGDVFEMLHQFSMGNRENIETFLKMRRLNLLEGLENVSRNTKGSPQYPLMTIVYNTSDSIRRTVRFCENVQNHRWDDVQKEA